MATVLAEVRRGPLVECRHYGAVAVAAADGTLLASAGEPGLQTYFRSSAKPFQALPIITSGAADEYRFTDAELAVCSASHNGEPAHLEVVAGLLARLGLADSHLQCGVVPPIDRAEAAKVATGQLAATPRHCDCSGKHSGMLAVCKRRGYPLGSYRDPNHPLQREILGLMSDFLGLPVADIPLGTDGCGVPTFAAPVGRIARAWALLAAPPAPYQDAARRILDAMAAEPYMVAGRGRICTDLMTLTGPSVVVKTGAEAVFCLALRERGWGVAIKVEDGNSRAMPVIVASVLQQLGLWDEATVEQFFARQSPQVRNNAGAVVGELRAAFTLN
jgi:L-asparaginase II